MTLVDEFGAIESMLLYSLVCTAVICERNDTELFHVTCQVTNQSECMKRGESSSLLPLFMKSFRHPHVFVPH